MTDENARVNIRIQTERGDASLESAEILLGAGKLADAVSRAYCLDADYTSEFVFTVAGATEEVDAAKRVVGVARDVLFKGGWR